MDNVYEKANLIIFNYLLNPYGVRILEDNVGSIDIKLLRSLSLTVFVP